MPYRQPTLLALAALLGGVAVVQHRSGAATRSQELFDRAHATLDRVESRLADRTTPRPTLDGSPLSEGSAFDEYAVAISAASRLLGGSQDEANALCATASDGIAEGAADARARLLSEPAVADVLDGIRRGTHSPREAIPITWFQDPARTAATMNAAQVLMADAHRALALGRSSDGAGRLLDLLQFGADLTGSPLGIGEALGLAALHLCDLETVIASHGEGAFSAADLDRLARAFAMVETRLAAPSQALEGELVFGREALTAAGPERGAAHARFILVHEKRFARLHRTALLEPFEQWRAGASNLQDELDEAQDGIARAFRQLRPLTAMQFRAATRDRLRASAIALNLVRGRDALELPEGEEFHASPREFEFVRSQNRVEVRCVDGDELSHIVLDTIE